MTWKKVSELFCPLEAKCAYVLLVKMTSPSEPTALCRQNAT